MYRQWLVFCLCALVSFSLVTCKPFVLLPTRGHEVANGWVHLSSTRGELPRLGSSAEQTASVVFDFDRDGVNDFAIAARGRGPSIVGYRRSATGWDAYAIEPETLAIEAGGVDYDIDGDGDRDLVFGGDYSDPHLWWWENPHPNHDPETPWKRREIKNSGPNKHHDQTIGDFDGDGRAELVFWNQKGDRLLLAEIPENPQQTEPWPFVEIFHSEGESEGLTQGDIDGDGRLDLVGGGRWFKYDGANGYRPQTIDDGQKFARVAVGQLVPGDRPEVVFVVGDGRGPLQWYQWDGSQWIGRDLLGFEVDHGHSLAVGDVNGDGHLDIFCAEMRLDGGNDDAKMWVFYGDSRGQFTREELATGFGNHESKLADLDGDGDLDILGKPYNWETPRLDIWLNEGEWHKRAIDARKPWRTVAIEAGDLNGDEWPDVVTGGWWYENPGSLEGNWRRRAIGAPLYQMGTVYDFDGDRDLDILGTEGKGADANARMVWARNDGFGRFTIFENIPEAEGDFLQGVAVGSFRGERLQVALSWHETGRGVQMLTVPQQPDRQSWTWERISEAAQDEALSAGDIDRDGDLDLLLGTKWLRNDGSGWSLQTLARADGDPDRNRLGDLNGDGRLDAIVGFEAISEPGPLVWYEQGMEVTQSWTERAIATPVGPMSLDVADFDGDRDLDVVVGEHQLEHPETAKVYWFENRDGAGLQWQSHLVAVGDEHHDGTQAIDLDRDGDLDLISIGWGHDRVLIYENTRVSGDLHASPEP